MVLLSVNAGSSSLKVSVYTLESLNTPFASLSVEGIGTEAGQLIPDGQYGSDATQTVPIESPKVAAELVKQWLIEKDIHPEEVRGVGHRVVHGGQKYTKAVLINDELVHYLESITPLAPNHMPATLTTIHAFLSAYPNTPQVACFDTSFFHNVPEVARVLPISLTIQKENNIRRYGFHGLSYESLLASFKEHEGETAEKGRVIMAHLGSGASLAACKNGQPIDMSMGFTPVSGIMMSTRSGDIEPGVLTYLQSEKNMSADDISKLVTYKSGLLGISESTANMRALLDIEDSNAEAKLAIDLFCYKIAKTIGGYAAALNGVDSIIFSGGIGERSAEIRERICKTLTFLGVMIDTERNGRNERLISSESSSVGVHVIPTREDYSIVTQTLAIIS